MIDWKWNSEKKLVFAHVVLTKTLCARKARDIRARIDHRLDLWEMGIHAGLVGDVLAEDRAREGRVERRVEEEEDQLVCSFHITLLSENLWQAVRQATGREREGYILPGDVCTKARRTVADFL